MRARCYDEHVRNEHALATWDAAVRDWRSLQAEPNNRTEGDAFASSLIWSAAARRLSCMPLTTPGGTAEGK